MGPKKYGRKINEADANRHFGLFIKLKTKAHIALKEALKGNDDALRYYCGKMGNFPEGEDLAFIFDREAIEDLVKLLCTKEADGLVIFPGVRQKEDSVMDKPGPDGKVQYGDRNGRPTVMVFSYKYEDAYNKDTSAILIDTKNGSEHPGTGGRSRPMSPDDNTKIPTIFEPGDRRHLS